MYLNYDNNVGGQGKLSVEWKDASNVYRITRTGSPLANATWYHIVFFRTGHLVADQGLYFNSTLETVSNGGLSATGGVTGTYLWTPNDFIDNTLANPVFSSTTSLTTTTTYTVTFTESVSGAACTATADVVITVNLAPTVTLIASPIPACVGNPITLTASASISGGEFYFEYNDGSGWINLATWSSINPQTHYILSNTDFRVSVREGSGCTASPYSNIITVPVVTFSSSPIWHN